MRKRRDILDHGSWSLVEELYDRGDPQFVAELRRITDADRLGNFAARWYGDQRPEARRLLLTYLNQPLNAFRHEALIKRLFKQAEAAGDTEVMGHFLVLFDRSVRRRKARGHRSASEVVESQQAAQERVRQWQAQGFNAYSFANYIRGDDGRHVTQGFRVYRSWTAEVLTDASDPPMWRPYLWRQGFRQQRPTPTPGPYPVEETFQAYLEGSVLFSLPTRHYLRRRSWRFFRKLGKFQPERYVAAVTAALKLYEDRDVADGMALLDRWGLVHILFHHSPVLIARRAGWNLAPGRGLSELAPAPAFESLWKASPRAFLELLREARCRTVRQWAVFMIRREQSALLQELSSEELLGLLASDDPVVAGLAADVLRGMADLHALGIERLLDLLATASADTLPILCELLEARLDASQVTIEQAVRLAISRPLPVARLGFRWLQTKTPTRATECRALRDLTEAQAEPLRPEMVRWMRGVLSAAADFQPDWVLDCLDSRHEDVRAEGWSWFQEEPRARDRVDLWQKLLESPYDDVRLQIVAELEKRTNGERTAVDLGQLDPELVRFLWAAVLLNIHRGGRKKPVAVQQLVRRLARQPAEAPLLLPILAVALRSLRGPEWRAGLTGVVQLANQKPELLPLVRQTFPELNLL
jgi:hypothetical protein